MAITGAFGNHERQAVSPSGSSSDARFPRVPLFGAFALIGFAMAAIIFGQVTEIGTVRVEHGAPVAIRDIVIHQLPDQSIRVVDAVSGETIDSFRGGEGGFVRGSLRAFDRMRMIESVGLDTPYRIIRWENGAVSLSDTGTGQRFYLDAFGRDNALAFAEFLKGHGHRGE